MGIGVRVQLLSACVLLAGACSDTHAPGDRGGSAGTGAGKGPMARGGSEARSQSPIGRAGSSPGGQAGSASGEGASCAERSERAASAVGNALFATAQSCSAHAECVEISIDTACHASCGAVVSVANVDAVQAAIDAQNASTCADFAADGCMVTIPPCIPRFGAACVQGQCTYLDEPPPEDAGAAADAGPRDAGAAVDGDTEVPGCVDRRVSWGWSGGLVAYVDYHELAPCSRFSTVRTDRGGVTEQGRCANEVGAAAEITVDDVDSAIAHPDVQQALAEAPALYGSDPRPLDSPVLRIEVSGAPAFEVGGPCNGSACTPIPPGVHALRDVLLSLARQQHALPDCDALQR